MVKKSFIIVLEKLWKKIFGRTVEKSATNSSIHTGQGPWKLFVHVNDFAFIHPMLMDNLYPR